VVPVRNAERTIAECVDSLLALEYGGELELIVAENRSTDGTRGVLERYGDAVRVVDAPRRGASAARNAGVAAARGDVVAFTDADCTVDRSWLRELVPVLGDPSVGIVGGMILARPPASAIELYGEHLHDQRRAVFDAPPYAITMNWASPRRVLEGAGGFDETLRRSEDCDLSYRIGAAGYAVAFCPSAVVYHRNERTLAGLFREGFQDGYRAVPVRRRHAGLLAAVYGNGLDEQFDRGLLPFIFGAGKRVGRALGELRFR
jgi:glycosyltransferase involved in cell wall biosynthesis